MKRLGHFLLATLLFISVLTGCSAQTSVSDDGKIRIVTTIFPEYDWIMQVLGDRAQDCEVTLLLDSGVDLHSYQPTAEDIMKISVCDLFVYVGGESDQWVLDTLKESANPDRQIVSLLELLGENVKEEELVEGMQEEEKEEDEEETEYDEHVWLSLRNAQTVTEALGQIMGQIDPDHAAEYADNAAAYSDELNKLDGEYTDAVAEASFHTLLFADRFPFRYLTEDYGLQYYAAFAGCSAEAEASFDTVIFLAGKTDELSLPAICQIESSDGTLPETVRQTTALKNQQIVTFDSMQSTTQQQVKEGKTYLGIMKENLDALKIALGE